MHGKQRLPHDQALLIMLQQLLAECGNRLRRIGRDCAAVSDEEFQIESIPTLLCIKGGKVVKRLVGFREKDALKKELEAL